MNRRNFLKGSGALVVSFSMARLADDLGLAPAVANAIAALDGERIRMLPFMGAGYVLI